METSRTNYFKLAWNDLKNSPGWVGKVALLSLVMCIPVFGLIVVYGYAFGWARDVSWGLHEPMPQRVFGNEDGSLYSRGFFVLVLAFVCSIIPSLAHELLYALLGVPGVSLLGMTDGSAFGSWLAFVPFAGVVFVLGFVAEIALQCFVTLFSWVGGMRIGIYDRLSAGFQLGKVWRMIRHDWRGLVGILVRVVVANIVLAAVVFAVVMVGVLAAFLVGVGFASAASDSSFAAAAPLVVLLVILLIALVVAFGFFALCASTALFLVEVRAVGCWTYQFDVASWRGQDDPMPFEIAPGR